nr:phage virion morphogenesis protein [Dyella sp. ASV21]
MTQLETWAAPLLAKLTPAARRSLAGGIARELRRAQQDRIAAQQSPNGNPFPPRKASSLRSKRGLVRRRQAAMFTKLRTARWLKAKATSDLVEVGFFGRVARLARVHQEGGEDHASPSGRMVRYPQRQLLGFTPATIDMVRVRLLEHLGRGGF